MAETTGPVGTGYEQPTPAEEPAALEAEIEETRRDMAETIEAIQARLDPELLKFKAEQRVEQAVDRAKDEVYDATLGRVEDATVRATRTVTDWRDNVIEKIKDNPFPAALVGIGLGWLLLEGSSGNGRNNDRNRRSDRQYGYGRGGYVQSDARSRYDTDGRGDARSRYGVTQERYYNAGDDGWRDRRGAVEQTIDRAEEGARRTMRQAEETWDDVSDGVRGRINQLREDASQLEDEARSKLDTLINELEQMVDDAEMSARRLRYKTERQARRARSGMQTMMEENPLAVGAVALAIGAAVGLAAPRTEMEDELMGDYRDQLVDRAQESAKRAKEQIGHVADEATDAARDAFQDVKEEARKAAQEVVDKTKGEAERSSGNLGESQVAREGRRALDELAGETRRATGQVGGELREAARDIKDEAEDATRNLGNR